MALCMPGAFSDHQLSLQPLQPGDCNSICVVSPQQAWHILLLCSTLNSISIIKPPPHVTALHVLCQRLRGRNSRLRCSLTGATEGWAQVSRRKE